MFSFGEPDCALCKGAGRIFNEDAYDYEKCKCVLRRITLENLQQTGIPSQYADLTLDSLLEEMSFNHVAESFRNAYLNILTGLDRKIFPKKIPFLVSPVTGMALRFSSFIFNRIRKEMPTCTIKLWGLSSMVGWACPGSYKRYDWQRRIEKFSKDTKVVGLNLSNEADPDRSKSASIFFSLFRHRQNTARPLIVSSDFDCNAIMRTWPSIGETLINNPIVELIDFGN